MIITRTPFRVSFVGGGTDINHFYRNGYGAVVSGTINKYVYITVNKRFDDSIRVSYSNTEVVDNVGELKHDIVRECLKMLKIDRGIEITSIADIPSGTGLGSSSSFTVGLLNALYTYLGQQRSARDLAEKACHVEIEILKHPIGKQDQYAAALGGINYFKFNSDDSVDYERINFSEEDISTLNRKLLIFYTGITRDSNIILENQSANIGGNFDNLVKMRNQADQFRKVYKNGSGIDKVGEFLACGWLMKKSVSNLISNDYIDSLYDRAIEAGAMGGKILGAGGGGFLMLFCSEELQNNVENALNIKRTHFQFTNHGSRVVYLGGE